LALRAVDELRSLRANHLANLFEQLSKVVGLGHREAATKVATRMMSSGRS